MPPRFAGLMPYEGYEDMLVEKNADGVVVATLNVPERLNALTQGIRVGLRRILEEVNDDDEAKVLVITGAGRGFSSGADMGGGAARAVQERTRRDVEESRFEWIGRFRAMHKPVIAAVNGVVAGGGLSLALASDVRIASTQARFVTAFIRRAILPDQCATWFLPRTVGVSRALLMLWLSDDVNAEDALRFGLVDEVVPHDDLMARVMELATRLAKGPSVTIELTKKAVYHGLTVDQETQANYEQNLLGLVERTEDVEEGRSAFRERRQPNFKGR